MAEKFCGSGHVIAEGEEVCSRCGGAPAGQPADTQEPAPAEQAAPETPEVVPDAAAEEAVVPEEAAPETPAEEAAAEPEIVPEPEA